MEVVTFRNLLSLDTEQLRQLVAIAYDIPGLFLITPLELHYLAEDILKQRGEPFDYPAESQEPEKAVEAQAEEGPAQEPAFAIDAEAKPPTFEELFGPLEPEKRTARRIAKANPPKTLSLPPGLERRTCQDCGADFMVPTEGSKRAARCFEHLSSPGRATRANVWLTYLIARPS